MKKHKLAKKALEHPELFAPAELAYFERWLRARKEHKEAEKQARRNDPGQVYEM
jgi:ferric-dicitrate binding protein FerR (iron transport regulator)